MIPNSSYIVLKVTMIKANPKVKNQFYLIKKCTKDYILIKLHKNLSAIFRELGYKQLFASSETVEDRI